MSDNVINFDFKKAASEKAASQDDAPNITFSQSEKKALIGVFKKGEDAGLFTRYHVYETSNSHESFHFYSTDKGDEHSAPVLSFIKCGTNQQSSGYICAPLFGKSDGFESFEGAMANLQRRVSTLIENRGHKKTNRPGHLWPHC